MAKKKPAHESDPVVEGIQIPLRLPDKRLAEALEAYSKLPKVRRSRNMAIVVLLEAAMQAEGLWPPPAPAE